MSKGWGVIRRSPWLVALLCCLPATGVAAQERLSWLYTDYPRVAEIFDSEQGPIWGERDQGGVYQLRFVIEGESLEDWTELLEISNTRRRREPDSVAQWFEQFRVNGDQTCPSEWRIIEQQASSMLFFRRARDCTGFPDQDALYRVLYGKRNVFVFFASRKGVMDDAAQEGWKKVLMTAEIRK